MSKLIALVIGAWTMYCTMIGSYDGAMAILVIYILTITLDPFELHHHKKAASAGDTDDLK